jgi:hypothetical protein
VGQRVTPFVRMYSSMTVSQLASEIISIDVSLRIEEITGMPVGSQDSDIRHCSQAEASDAAAAQMAAQTLNEDNRTSIQKASLVRAQASSYPDLSGCSGRRNSQWLLTEQTCRDMKLCSTSSSLDCEKSALGCWRPMIRWGIATAARQRLP